MKSKLFISFAAGVVLTYIILNRQSNNAYTLLHKAQNDIKIIQNKNNQKIAEVTYNLTENQEGLKALTDSVFYLPKREARKVKIVKEYIYVEQEYKADFDYIPFLDTTTIALTANDCDSLILAQTRYIIPPKDFQYSDSNITIVGKVVLHGISIDSFKLSNTVSIRLSEKKDGLFGRKSVIQVLNSNPSINTINAGNFIQKQKPSWWYRWGKPVVVGAVVGLITYQIAK